MFLLVRITHHSIHRHFFNDDVGVTADYARIRQGTSMSVTCCYANGPHT